MHGINRGEYVITFLITCNMYVIRDVIISDALHWRTKYKYDLRASN
jgi:hypothetical protein